MNHCRPRACPPCGADPGPAMFCAACGNRLRWTVLASLGRTLLQGGVVALALLALPVSALFVSGGMLTVTMCGADALGLTLCLLLGGALLGWMVVAMVRHAHALEGHAEAAVGGWGRSS